MKLVEEYKNQNSWRDWNSYIKKLPINKHNTICDMGCSIGAVTKKLANNAYQVIGIDNNSELIEEARKINTANNIHYLTDDLKTLDYQKLPYCDGIWSSFVVSYFPNLIPILNNWKSILNPNGWLSIVEMSALFSHEPLSQNTQEIFEEYYVRQRSNNSYDFEMGMKIKDLMIDSGLSIIYEENVYDKELVFDGPAEQKILKS